jgi:hypothetical protein
MEATRQGRIRADSPVWLPGFLCKHGQENCSHAKSNAIAIPYVVAILPYLN